MSSEFKGAHQLQALALAEFPGDKSAGRYKLPSDVRSVISVMLQHGANLPTLQESQVAKLRSLARVCKSITEEMKRILAASLPPSVCAVGDCMNVAFALVLAKERQWQHYWISHVLLLGFPITGDMESTGVLQPRDEPHKVEQGIRRVELLRLFGWPIEAPKSQEAGVVNKFLGMMGDTSLASTLNRSEADPLEVSFYPNDDWVGNILDIMDQCDPAAGGSGTMTPHQAEVLLGKLGFLLRGAHGSIGREASQPIFLRKHDLTGQLAWNEALTHSFSFFLKLFTRFPVLTWRLDVDETPWLLVYTDACKNPRFGGLGVVIFDRATGRRYVSSAICPKDIEESFARGRHIINQLELLAILTGLLTFPQLLGTSELCGSLTAAPPCRLACMDTQTNSTWPRWRTRLG